MAGIKVPQYEIFKIETAQLKYNNWNLHITKDEAYASNSLVALFEGQEFRLIAQILNQPIEEIEFSDYIAAIVISNKKHFSRAVSHEGVLINGFKFRRFVGTSGGLKKNTIIFVRESVLDELNRRCECGRNPNVPLVPAKLETYKALTCSASQPICDPKGILVVSDCLIKFEDYVKVIDDSGDEIEPFVSDVQKMELENNACDGFNLCTYEYMERVAESLGLDYVPSGVCLRNAWLKGMLYPFPIMEFADEVAGGNYVVKDIWGNEKDIREVEMILNESSLKLWKCYNSIEEYVAAYHENGYCFAVTKIAPHELEDVRETNYQYLQSYQLSDRDIEELCAPTVKWLKDSMGGNYEATLKFLGITDQVEHNTWQQALFMDKRFLNDTYIADSIYRMIRNKIDEAKIGKLLVHGNYQLLSGDPYIFMEHVFGMEPRGLLKAGECHSSYWCDLDVDTVVAFRSPMTVHNNIRKCKVVNNSLTKKWYRYIPNTFIINGFDTFCQATNGADFDGDIIFSTDDRILLNNHRDLPAVLCVQHNTEKIIPTEEDILATNINAMGNQVGSITNRVTAMMEKQSGFSLNSKEYLELEKRIEAGQLYQQAEIDKIKGIIAKPMPDYWYTPAACKGDDYLYSICTYKKPYFMTYIYDDYKHKYTDYIKNREGIAQRDFNKSLEEVLAEGIETEFIEYYNKGMPFGMGACTMNRICWHIEKEFKNIQSAVRRVKKFDHTFLLFNTLCTSEHREALVKASIEYGTELSAFKKFSSTKASKVELRNSLKRKYKYITKQLCPDDKERLNLLLELNYTKIENNQFMWDCGGDLIIKRLQEVNNR